MAKTHCLLWLPAAARAHIPIVRRLAEVGMRLLVEHLAHHGLIIAVALIGVEAAQAESSPCEQLRAELLPSGVQDEIAIVATHDDSPQQISDGAEKLLFTNSPGYFFHPHNCDSSGAMTPYIFHPIGIVVRDTGWTTVARDNRIYRLIETEYGLYAYARERELTALHPGEAYLFANDGTQFISHCRAADACTPILEGKQGDILHPRLRYARIAEETSREQLEKVCRALRADIFNDQHRLHSQEQQYVLPCIGVGDVLKFGGAAKLVAQVDYARMFEDNPKHGFRFLREFILPSSVTHGPNWLYAVRARLVEFASRSVEFLGFTSGAAPAPVTGKACGIVRTSKLGRDGLVTATIGGEYYVLRSEAGLTFSFSIEDEWVSSEDLFILPSVMLTTSHEPIGADRRGPLSPGSAAVVVLQLACDSGIIKRASALLEVQVVDEGLDDKQFILAGDDIERSVNGHAPLGDGLGQFAGLALASTTARGNGQIWAILDHIGYFRFRNAIMGFLGNRAFSSFDSQYAGFLTDDQLQRAKQLFTHMLIVLLVEPKPDARYLTPLPGPRPLLLSSQGGVL